ncbi:hypothetical protein K1719_019824 [Acacia pycnantha]|nr:hypothetical protein K1719_019824 [Acacia pycnantha]
MIHVLLPDPCLLFFTVAFQICSFFVVAFQIWSFRMGKIIVIVRVDDSNTNRLLYQRCGSSIIKESVPKLDLDDDFQQKNEIAKAVEEELDKVNTNLEYV